ncbi:TonB-dependent receptor [Halioxenophilus sp. WMMB6]|uniref:TonB-dependent receptor n=1 Tax=Halioxenophilus sp. WMMB6 TaxID=3073815 RepID=UPI00295E51B0|nr:TonB-dependent receptor [Halioxenophilus sp. WMMB6]
MKTKQLAVAIAGLTCAQVVPQAYAEQSKQYEMSLEEIVVTATRRAERLQEVPLAVNAVSGEQLKKTAFKDITDIAYTFSGVQYGETPNDDGFRVRGIGTMGGFSSASEAPVGLVVDNVVVGFGNPMGSLGDIERVEVLKGPQGTQFGKNASSGVINVTTRRPDTEAFSGSIYTSYATLNEHDINGLINLPLSDTMAMSVYAFSREHDGYVDNVVRNEEWGGRKNYGTRVKFSADPSDTLSLYLIADYSKEKLTGPGQVWTLNKLSDSAASPGGAFGLPFVDLNGLGVTVGSENDESIEDGEGYIDTENYGVSLQADLDIGEYTLSSITAWREYNEGEFRYAIDAAPYSKFKARETGQIKRLYSQELRITSPAHDSFEYVAGLYLSRQETGLGNDASATLAPAQPYLDQPVISITNGDSTTQTTSDSAAIFIDGKFHINNQFSLLGGLRLTRDKVEAETYSQVDNDFATDVTIPYGPRPYQKADASETDVSGRFGVEYQAAEDLLLYGTYAKGYLGPTITFSGLTGTQSSVAPQKVDDVTIGFKSQFMDRRLTLNGNIFYDDFTDLQTSVFDGFEFLTQNAGGAETKGLELEVTYLMTPNLTVNASYTYSDAEFTDYITDCPKSIVAAGNELTLCAEPGSNSTTHLYQADGQPLPGAPKNSAVLGFVYDNQLTDKLLFDIAANASYRSATQNSVGDKNTIQEGYTIVNLSAGLNSAEDTWRVGLFVRNLFDKDYNSAILSLPFADAGSYVNWRVRNAERTVGAEVSYSF